MKKIIFILLCFLIACLIFVIVVFLLNGRKGKGALQVTSSPNAKVYINDKLVGQSPLCLCDSSKMLEVGEYTIKLVPIEGSFETFQRKINITPKVLTVVDRTFAQTANSQASIISLTSIEDKKDAQINVISFPSDVEVYLDSELVGRSPVLLKNVTESDHEIKLSKAGYLDKSVRIKAVLGYKLEAIIYMGIDPKVVENTSASIASASAEIKEDGIDKIIILETPTGFLRVREDASVGSAEVGRVKPNEEYELIEEKEGWYKIKIKEDLEGWVSSQYSEKKK